MKSILAGSQQKIEALNLQLMGETGQIKQIERARQEIHNIQKEFKKKKGVYKHDFNKINNNLSKLKK